MLNKWHTRFMDVAKLVSSWSKDSTQVGAVIVRGKHILTTGYNGFPAKLNDDPARIADRTTKLKYTVHAEMNAILQATQHGLNLTGATLYVYGLPPCVECAKHIVASGIENVFFTVTGTPNQQWLDDKEFVLSLFSEAKIYWEEL